MSTRRAAWRIRRAAWRVCGALAILAGTVVAFTQVTTDGLECGTAIEPDKPPGALGECDGPIRDRQALAGALVVVGAIAITGVGSSAARLTRRLWEAVWRILWLRFALGIAGVVGFLWLIVVEAPPWFVDNDTLAGLEAQNDVRTTLLQAVAGIVLFVGAYFTWRQLRTAREGQITDRYTRAIEQLGHQKVDVRVGGIYALERIARDSAPDRVTVGEVLTAFIRTNSPWPPSQPEQADATVPIEELPNLQVRAPDVQASLTVLGRGSFTPPEHWRYKLDLTRVDLRRANLSGANLQDAKFSRANLQNAALGGANLDGAAFIDANLEGVDLFFAYLQGANLSGANLQKATVLAKMERAHLDGADLQGADLSGTQLRNAYLENANLQGADLRRANLQGAYLGDANLQRAKLQDANLGGAKLKGASLVDANLHNANFSPPNLAVALFQAANPRGANLEGADLEGAYLWGASLRGANLKGAKASRTTWPDGFDWRAAGVISLDEEGSTDST